MIREPADHARNLHIINNPKYAELTKKRNAFSITLTIITLVGYFGFILLIAYGKDFLGMALGPDTVITLGLPIGVAVILGAIILTGIYVKRANSEFDALNHQIITEAHQ